MAGYGGRAFLKGKLGIFSISPVLTVIQGKKATFHVRYLGEDEKIRQNLFFRIGSSVVSTAMEHLRL